VVVFSSGASPIPFRVNSTEVWAILRTAVALNLFLKAVYFGGTVTGLWSQQDWTFANLLPSYVMDAASVSLCPDPGRTLMT
jgi:hypothetical protein